MGRLVKLLSPLHSALSILLISVLSSLSVSATGLPVKTGHPRILLTPSVKAALIARKDANDPKWVALKAVADQLCTYSILQFKFASRGDAPENTIYYTYQGEGWYYAAMPLALAYQMTGDSKYSDKLLALVDEMARAQTDPDNMPPNGRGPLVPDNYYSTRNLCPVLAIVYDWCFDKLTAQRKLGIINLMRLYYNEIRDSAYQRNDHADGNYYVGHLFGTAMMGYASYGDNQQAQEMIDWARIRFDGGTAPTVAAEHTPEDFFSQLFEGGTRPQPAREYQGPNITGAPHKGGIHLQGWAYGSATYNWIIDYLLTIKSATDEDLIASHASWWGQMLRALKSGLHPNKFCIDNTGDFGGNYGAVISKSLPVRLAYITAGTPDGPGAQNFAYNEIAKNSPYPIDFPDDIYLSVYQPMPWEAFLFSDESRQAQELLLPTYYSGFGPVYPQGGPTNGAIPFFYMRSDWGPNATWASLHQGAAWYDDHMHADAGTFQITHANDYLLVDATNWKGETGSIGIVGSSQNAQYNAGAGANTLFMDDYGTYLYDPQADSRFCGGQGLYGRDIVIAAEQTTDYSYIRADHTSAFVVNADTTDTTPSTLEAFYRSFTYLPKADLFVCFDQTRNAQSTSPRGPFRKHIRWHFPNIPTTNGNTIRMEQGASRLNMSVLLPDQARITLVDENANPDPCDGIDPNCVPYEFNSGTWRAEVSDPANSLSTPFLTVLQPSFKTEGTMQSTLVTAAFDAMVGARIAHPSKGVYVVMFNNNPGSVPSPLNTVAYQVADAQNSQQTLCGMMPSTKYKVEFSGINVSVSQDAAGTYQSTPGGVLQFGTSVTSVDETIADNTTALNIFPNPITEVATYNFTVETLGNVSVKLYDAVGNVAQELLNTTLAPGPHSVTIDAKGLANGSYRIVQSAGCKVQSAGCRVVR